MKAELRTGSNHWKAESSWPAAIIAGASQTGVLGVRTLQRRGVRTLLFDCDPNLPGFSSAYGPARQVPNPDVDSDQWVQAVIRLGNELGGKPVLVPSSDRYVSAMAKHAEMLRSHFRMSETVDIQGKLADKETQYELAKVTACLCR